MAKHVYNAEALQRAFLAAAETGGSDRILDLGWAGRSLCVGVAGREAYFVGDREAYFVGDDVRAARLCANTGVEAFHLESPAGVPGLFHAAFYHPEGHAAKGQVFEWIEICFEKLHPNGALFFAGQKDRGVLSYVKHIERVFGQVDRIGRSGRVLFFRAKKGDVGPGVVPTVTNRMVEDSTLTGSLLRFVTRDGVFSRDGIDPGSRLLLDHVDIPPDANVLDMGCGYGLLGLVCAHRAPQGHVWMGDISARAIACARESVAQNKVLNATADISDLYEAFEGKTFDLIVSNPPFHEGNRTAWPFIDGARERLKPNGQFMIVVMRAAPYVKRMGAVFGSVEVCAESGGYTVLRVRKKEGETVEPTRRVMRVT
ncbi:MAG: class I SAM-dependent methyltransferase [bacterium]|nr:class I SAM-dependent methyltransferase [bacterium]